MRLSPRRVDTRYEPRDGLCVRGGDPDNRASAVRSMEVEVLYIEHRTAGRRVTRIRVALSGFWTGWWR
jgi:hypothetical protein